MFFMKISSKICREILFQIYYRQLQIFKSISGLHCDFKCEISSIESPARGAHTCYKYVYSVFDCRVKSLSRCFNGFSYVPGQPDF